MAVRKMKLRFAIAPVALILAAISLSACGGGSGGAAKLLQQTFTGTHKVNSGKLQFSLRLSPSGSSAIRGPVSLTFGGPFQSLGAGKLPQSNFDLGISALGRSISLGLISTGTTGYVSFQGTSYQLPQAAFQKLESSFAQLDVVPGSKGSGLSKLGIHPLGWLRNPRIVGDETVGGTATTHVHSAINVAAFLRDFSTFLQHASSVGASGASSFPRGLSQSTISNLTSAIRNPSLDVWTGKVDKSMRRLRISMTAALSGQLATVLGHSLGIALDMQYGDLNQPQTITAPSNPQPYSQFQSKLQSLTAALQNGVGGALGGSSGSSSSGSSGSSGSSSGPAASQIQSYSQCIQNAAGDVGKMQQCASLLTGK
jgi:hypothetical protein